MKYINILFILYTFCILLIITTFLNFKIYLNLNLKKSFDRFLLAPGSFYFKDEQVSVFHITPAVAEYLKLSGM